MCVFILYTYISTANMLKDLSAIAIDLSIIIKTKSTPNEPTLVVVELYYHCLELLEIFLSDVSAIYGKSIKRYEKN